MPFIHVKSLPLDKSIDISALTENISKDFAQETGIGIEHVSATWEFFHKGHYIFAGKAAYSQPLDSHPILVDLLAPDFNGAEVIEKMLVAIASSISIHTNVPKDNIFINFRQAHSGMVFDSGAIVRW